MQHRTATTLLAAAWLTGGLALTGGTSSADNQAASAASTAATTACPTGWGSTPDGAARVDTASGLLTGVQTGRHPCFDRLVLDGASWARVRYVDQVTQDGSGAPVPLRGGARLEILTTRADDVRTGEPGFDPADPGHLADVSAYRTFRQVAFAGSFEGRSTVGLGLRARLPFRVLVVDAGTPRARVVVDIAHQW